MLPRTKPCIESAHILWAGEAGAETQAKYPRAASQTVNDHQRGFYDWQNLDSRVLGSTDL